MDTPKRVLVINLQRKSYADEPVMTNINYLGANLDLTSSDVTSLVSSIPEYWNTEKDYLVKFVWLEDNTYICQRKKQIFNFTTRQTEEKLYFFDYAPKEQVDELVSFFTNYFTTKKIEKIDNLYDTILNSLGDFSYLKYSLMSARQKLLAESDYRMMTDYPLDEEQKELWSTYRQELRDITSQQAWIDNNMLEVKMPVSPEPKNQMFNLFNEVAKTASIETSNIPPNLLDRIRDDIKGTGYANIISNFTSLTVKVEILRSIVKLKLPFVNIDEESLNTDNILPYKLKQIFPEIENYNIGYTEQQSLDLWYRYLEDVEAKTAAINEKLKEYDVNFTLGDIFNSVAEYTKNKINEIAVTDDVGDLLNDLSQQTEIEGE
jgi:hypothetical protein